MGLKNPYYMNGRFEPHDEPPEITPAELAAIEDALNASLPAIEAALDGLIAEADRLGW